MTITIQITEVPENEAVPNRVLTLPENGGTLGSGFESIVQLPDRSGGVAPVHARFIKSSRGMLVDAEPDQRVTLDGVALEPGRPQKISDGNVLRIAGYTLLVSVSGVWQEAPQEQETFDDTPQTAPFSLSDDLGELDFEQVSQSKPKKKEPAFAFHGVLVDDPFAEDPFADGDLDIQSEVVDEADTAFIDEDVEVVGADFTLKQYRQDDDKLNRLLDMVERQQGAQSEQQKRLFDALDQTLDAFLREFAPEHLEEEFSDYGTPWLSSKDKRYWRLYRKHYLRRQKKGDFHRLFKALLMENMQKQES